MMHVLLFISVCVMGGGGGGGVNMAYGIFFSYLIMKKFFCVKISRTALLSPCGS